MMVGGWNFLTGSFHTFAKMEEIMEIVVVCDPSYRDIFEGLPLQCSVMTKQILR